MPSEEVSVDVNASETCTERETIIAAARALLSRSDIQISRRSLAQRAGVTTATLQRHFRCLADLLAELGKTGAAANIVELEIQASRVEA